jgi:hypothetical protein
MYQIDQIIATLEQLKTQIKGTPLEFEDMIEGYDRSYDYTDLVWVMEKKSRINQKERNHGVEK